MDSFRKKLARELQELQETGRVLRNMSLAHMITLESGGWRPAVDIYESDGQILLYVDLAGVDTATLDVLVDEQQVQVQGSRQLACQETIHCIHQLEIELGRFERTISLPALVDVNKAVSSYRDGILLIVLAKKEACAKVNIHISSGA